MILVLIPVNYNQLHTATFWNQLTTAIEPITGVSCGSDRPSPSSVSVGLRPRRLRVPCRGALEDAATTAEGGDDALNL